MSVHREVDLAWAAGFFEGEGSVGLQGARLAAQVKNNNADPLATFQHAVEAGRIYGPYLDSSRTGTKPFWVWVAHDAEAMAVLRAIAPWLSERRLLQAELALGQVRGAWEAPAVEAMDWLKRVRKRP